MIAAQSTNTIVNVIVNADGSYANVIVYFDGATKPQTLRFHEERRELISSILSKLLGPILAVADTTPAAQYRPTGGSSGFEQINFFFEFSFRFLGLSWFQFGASVSVRSF